VALSIYLLDANACIRYLNGKAPGLRSKLQAVHPDQIRICSIVKAEMLVGALRSTDLARTTDRQRAFFRQFVSVPFDDVAAEAYGRLRADLIAAGGQIGPHDMLIAATAIANGLVLVTHNTREFSRAPGLVVEDWEI
jgi:tRNA(fMet)-specific endonuclease VapC